MNPGPKRQAIIDALRENPNLDWVAISQLVGASYGYVQAIGREFQIMTAVEYQKQVRAGFRLSPDAKQIECTAHELASMFNEADMFVDALREFVNEGELVEETSRFARWLTCSGLLSLFERNRCDLVYHIDGAALRRKVGDLLQECGARMGKGNITPPATISRMRSIDDRLARLEQLLSKAA